MVVDFSLQFQRGGASGLNLQGQFKIFFDNSFMIAVKSQPETYQLLTKFAGISRRECVKYSRCGFEGVRVRAAYAPSAK